MVTTFAASISCEGYSQVCMILLLVLRSAEKDNEQSCIVRLWCSKQMCLWCPWFLTSAITLGPSFFSSINISPFSVLWSENSDGTVSGYEEQPTQPKLPRTIRAVQRVKYGTNSERYTLNLSWQVLDLLSSYLLGMCYIFLFKKLMPVSFKSQRKLFGTLKEAVLIW